MRVSRRGPSEGAWEKMMPQSSTEYLIGMLETFMMISSNCFKVTFRRAGSIEMVTSWAMFTSVSSCTCCKPPPKGSFGSPNPPCDGSAPNPDCCIRPVFWSTMILMPNGSIPSIVSVRSVIMSLSEMLSNVPVTGKRSSRMFWSMRWMRVRPGPV